MDNMILVEAINDCFLIEESSGDMGDGANTIWLHRWSSPMYDQCTEINQEWPLDLICEVSKSLVPVG